MPFSERQFTIVSSDARIGAEIIPLSCEDGISLYRFRAHFAEKCVPAPVRITWEEEMRGLLHVWHPIYGAGRMHQWFGPTVSNARFAFGAPMLATIGEGDTNAMTVALSEVVHPTSISFCVKDLDQKNKVGYGITFFSEHMDAIDSYEADIRIDERPLPYYETLQAVYPWWRQYGHDIPAPPAAAEDALYSSWYNFHQAPEAEKLLADLKIAAEMGFKTVILDDGWQFPGPSSGDYALCGAWEMSPDKFPDFKAFADGVHELGMKLMVWFAVPFVGVDSPLFARFEDKFLFVDRAHENFGMNTGVLDPRYPDVRAFIISNYARFLRDYDIDGFKFDFVDSMSNFQQIPYAPEKGMDCESVSAGILCLMQQIQSELGAMKPDLLYEYRQNYIGPAINRFGNMLRVGDCAYDAQANRFGILNLRMLGYPVAVHADMLFWSPSESERMCARQLLNILFAVPQISVILAESTQMQKELVAEYLAYWTENREILLHGKLQARHPEQNYSYVSAENDEKRIAVLYSDYAYAFDGKDCDIHHMGNESGVLFENNTDSPVTVGCYGRFARTLLGETEVLPHSVVRVAAEPTDMLRVRREAEKRR